MDDIIRNVLHELGVDQSIPPTWIPHYYISKADPPIGGKRQDGWTCSFCGKHSYIKAEICSGCDSHMENIDEKRKVLKNEKRAKKEKFYNGSCSRD